MHDRIRVSPDQAATFVALARNGSIRAAAQELFITEQGARNRLLSLEAAMGVPLYHKERGRRSRTQLTREGLKFLPAARAFLRESEKLGGFFRETEDDEVIEVAASAYLTFYVLIGIVRKFHNEFPGVRVRLSTRSEREIEQALVDEGSLSVGISAPYQASTMIHYEHQFSMNWSLVAPEDHPLITCKNLKLEDITNYPLILFEHGSTGREHVLEAFQSKSLHPHIEMEATSSQIIIAMVEAGLGLSILPLLPDGSVTRGHQVATRSLHKEVRHIQSGILTRKDGFLSDAENQFISFLKSHMPK